MRKTNGFGHSVVCCLFSLALIAPCAAIAKSSFSVASRIEQQNALFDEQYESDLKSHPELATAYGDYRFNDRLNDYSLAEVDRQHQRDEDFLARLKAISTSGFPEQDALSH